MAETKRRCTECGGEVRWVSSEPRPDGVLVERSSCPCGRRKTTSYNLEQNFSFEAAPVEDSGNEGSGTP